MTSSSDVDKVLRKKLNPVLKANGFSKINGRTAWGWHEDAIWVFNIRAVGNYHSEVTGWPAASLTVWLGIYYKFFPEPNNLRKDENGIIYPKEWECHRRSQLICSYSQLDYTKNIDSWEAEKTRNDVFWTQPDGSNIEIVINDIKDSFLNYAVDWFKQKSNKELTLKEITNPGSYYFDKIIK